MVNLLEGVRVLDLTNVLSGPLCSYQLAQLGADVIKVETPKTGDLARQLGSDPSLNKKLMGASFIAQNAGKRSLTLNLKTVEGVEVLKKLAATADVVVENFRPGVMDRLGVGQAVLRAANPKLIYCAISGFGQGGPLRANPAYDQVVQGFGGVMSITGSEESGALRAGFPVADTAAGLTAAFAITAALYSGIRTGKGEFIDVSMLEATLVSLGWVVSNYLIASEIPKLMGNDNMSAAPSGAFRTGDGLLNIAANKQEHYIKLCSIIGRKDLAVDPRFQDRDERRRNRAQLTPLLEEALAKKTALEWHAILTRESVPAGPVLSIEQALAQEQVKERGLVRKLEDVPLVDRPIEVMRVGFTLEGSEVGPESPPPTLGQHTDDILAELGFDRVTISAFREREII